MADELDARAPDDGHPDRRRSASPMPTPRGTQWVQTLAGVPLFILSGARWLLYLLTATTILRAVSDDFGFLPTVPLWLLIVGLAIFATPFGRMAIAVVGCADPARRARAGRLPARRLRAPAHVARRPDRPPGRRGRASPGAPWVTNYARALGATIGARRRPAHAAARDRHADDRRPRRDRARGRPRRHWIDGDVVRIGRVRIGAGSTIGARSTLLPGARIGRGAEIAPGSAVFGRVPAGQRWAGSPAERIGPASPDQPTRRPGATRWLVAYGAVVGLPLAAADRRLRAGGAVIAAGHGRRPTRSARPRCRALAWLVPGDPRRGGRLRRPRRDRRATARDRAATRGGIRCAAGSAGRRGPPSGCSTPSRTILFPLYSSLFTPVWLRMLGAEVGRGVEASTVLLIPSMTTIDDHAFLADDTMVASYELQGGWMRLDRARIGKRAFLGNSGIAAAGHRLAQATHSSPCCRSAPAEVEGGHVVARVARRCGCAARRSRPTRAAPTGRRTGLRVARALWELCRIVPVFVTCAIGLGVLFTLAALTVARSACSSPCSSAAS